MGFALAAILTGSSFCTTVSEKVFIAANGCEIGFVGTLTISIILRKRAVTPRMSHSFLFFFDLAKEMLTEIRRKFKLKAIPQ
jgi:hypothetical protein